VSADYRAPTHVLTVSVPLHLDEDDTFDYDPVYQALSVVMAVSRLAVDGALCGNVDVTITPT
jgi:hypothetical protein